MRWRSALFFSMAYLRFVGRSFPPPLSNIFFFLLFSINDTPWIPTVSGIILFRFCILFFLYFFFFVDLSQSKHKTVRIMRCYCGKFV